MMLERTRGDMMRAGDRLRCGRSVVDAASARRFVGDTLSFYGAPDEVVETLRLAASELVSNALVARRSNDDPPVAIPVEITVETGVDGWGLEVLGGWQPADHQLWDTSRWRIRVDDRASGRGLGLVRALVDDVEVHRFDAQAIVRCWIRGRGGRRLSPALVGY